MNNPPVYNTPVPASPIYAPLTIPLNSVRSIPVPAFHDPDRSDSKVFVQQVSKLTATVDLTAYS
jgi:hypothetical protein